MTKKRWVALLSAVAIVLAAALTTAAVIGHGSGRKAADDSPLLAPTLPSTAPTTAKPVTTTTLKAQMLPQPIAPPADPYAPSPIIQIGVHRDPEDRHEVTPIFEGITLTVIDHGPGHWPGSCDAGPARQLGVPRPSRHAHTPVPEPRSVVAR